MASDAERLDEIARQAVAAVVERNPGIEGSDIALATFRELLAALPPELREAVRRALERPRGGP